MAVDTEPFVLTRDPSRLTCEEIAQLSAVSKNNSLALSRVEDHFGTFWQRLDDSHQDLQPHLVTAVGGVESQLRAGQGEVVAQLDKISNSTERNNHGLSTAQYNGIMALLTTIQTTVLAPPTQAADEIHEQEQTHQPIHKKKRVCLA